MNNDNFVKAVIAKVELKECETKDKKSKFKVLNYWCVVDGYKKMLTGSMSVDYAKKYFKHCGLKSSKDLINLECLVLPTQEAFISNEGTPVEFTKIKYLNLIDENGEPIRLPKEDTDEKEELTF